MNLYLMVRRYPHVLHHTQNTTITSRVVVPTNLQSTHLEITPIPLWLSQPPHHSGCYHLHTTGYYHLHTTWCYHIHTTGYYHLHTTLGITTFKNHVLFKLTEEIQKCVPLLRGKPPLMFWKISFLILSFLTLVCSYNHVHKMWDKWTISAKNVFF